MSSARTHSAGDPASRASVRGRVLAYCAPLPLEDSLKVATLDISRVALKRRRTKIIATVGPASNTPEKVGALIDAGVDVFRLNFSHGTHEQHGAVFRIIREESERRGKLVAVLGDLCGPKIRVGKFEEGFIELTPGETVTITTREVLGRAGLIPSEYRLLHEDVAAGSRILLDDGKLEVEVNEVEGTEITVRVINGGRLSNKKGMNLPGTWVSAPALTEKDKVDAAFAAELGVDYLALSFVRSAADVRGLKEFLAGLGADIPVVAKIEKPEALVVIDQILAVTDAIMVARGDLGVEMKPEEVPIVQQELIRLAMCANRPVIVATQMMESMIENPRPTRAEVSDVSTAASAFADAVMLSAESAAGKYPVEAVATMDRVLRQTEGYQWKRGLFGHPLADHSDENDTPQQRNTEGLSRATSVLSREMNVRAVVVPSRSGATATVVSSQRPAAPVIAVSHLVRIARRFSLLWGVSPEVATVDALTRPDELARELSIRLGLAEPGQSILLVWDASRDRKRMEPTVSILPV